MKVVVSARAGTSIDTAWDYIAERNPQAADRLLQDIEACLDVLGEHPEAGRATDEIGTRMRPTKRYSYLVFYEILAEVVSIIDVRHPGQQRPASGRP